MLGRRRTLPSSFSNAPYRPPRKRTPTVYAVRTSLTPSLRRASRNVRTGGFTAKERKFVDYNVASYSVTAAWSVADSAVGALNAIAQGSGEMQRIGRKCTNSSLHIRGYVELSDSIYKAALCRIIVVRDSQTNGAQLSPTAVMDQGVNGFRNLEWVSRFSVVYDRTLTLHPTPFFTGSTALGNAPVVPFNVNVRLSGDTTFTDNSADVSDISDVSYHILCCSEDAGSVKLTYTSRFRFFG